MQQVESLSLEQIEEFLEGAQGIEFRAEGRAEKYALFEALLERHRYSRLGRARKGLLRRFLGKVSGLSRAQTTRLIGRYRRERRVRPQSYRRRRFPKLYTRADIVLLARVDEAHRQLSGPATCAILRREYAVRGRREFARLARLSPAHLYNLRRRRAYLQQRRPLAKTRPAQTAIGERRQPQPQGRPGYVRVDTVHSPEEDGVKGAYTINLVDEVTQWQVLGCVERISEQYLAPLLAELLAQFPFPLRGFHSDNGSEYINHTTARLLAKLHIEFTKSRARRSNDNALVETKNGAVVRKWLGYQFLPSAATAQIHAFYRDWLNPYLNFHRPCACASWQPDRSGKPRKVYRLWQTPYEALLALPDEQRTLRSTQTLQALRQQAAAHSPTVFAELLQERLAGLQQTCKNLALPWAIDRSPPAPPRG